MQDFWRHVIALCEDIYKFTYLVFSAAAVKYNFPANWHTVCFGSGTNGAWHQTSELYLNKYI